MVFATHCEIIAFKMAELKTEPNLEGEEGQDKMVGMEIEPDIGLLMLASNCFYDDRYPDIKTEFPPPLLMSIDTTKGSAVYVAEILSGRNLPVSDYLLNLLGRNQHIHQFRRANKKQ